MIPQGGRLCDSGLFLLSLTLVCAFGWFRCLQSLKGACLVVLSLFLLICLLFELRMPCLSSYILCASFRWTCSFGFEIGSRGLAAIFVWFFSSVPGARGALLIKFYSLVANHF